MGNEGFARITGHCVKCGKRTDMVNIKVYKIMTRKGIRRTAKGLCKVCGTGMTKLLPTK